MNSVSPLSLIVSPRIAYRKSAVSFPSVVRCGSQKERVYEDAVSRALQKPVYYHDTKQKKVSNSRLWDGVGKSPVFLGLLLLGALLLSATAQASLYMGLIDEIRNNNTKPDNSKVNLPIIAVKETPPCTTDCNFKQQF
jgi:hypothetical protein